ncbi:MAG: hypothetical protein WBD31_09780 [Rubripirellula sp.]
MNNSTRMLASLAFALATCVPYAGNAFAQHAEPKVDTPQIDRSSSTDPVATKKATKDRPTELPETDDSFPPVPEALEPNDFDRPAVSPSSPKTNIMDQEFGAVLTPDEPSKSDTSLEEMSKILEGQSPPPSGWPTQRVVIRQLRQIPVTDPDGNQQFTSVYETLSVDPNKKDLSSKDRHALFVQLIEKQIQSTHEKLLKTDDRGQRAAVLDTLKQAYADRFRVDTAYQNLKVTEIESRAKKLREELTERAESEKNWVNAMTTLAEMRANGIDPMVSMGNSQPPLTASSYPVPNRFEQSRTTDSQPFPTFGDSSLAEEPFDTRLPNDGRGFPSPTPDPRNQTQPNSRFSEPRSSDNAATRLRRVEESDLASPVDRRPLESR